MSLHSMSLDHRVSTDDRNAYAAGKHEKARIYKFPPISLIQFMFLLKFRLCCLPPLF